MPRSLRLTALPAILLFVALLTPRSSASDPALLRMADPTSNFVIGIDVQGLLASPLAQEAIFKAQAENPDWQEALGALGPNPLDRVQEVLIAGDIEQARDSSKGLLLVRGDFADDAWMALACQDGCLGENYNGFTIQNLENADKPGAFVKLDANYVALGSPDQIRGVVDRRSAGSGFASRLGSWTSNSGGHHIWVSAKGPFDMPNQGPAAMGMASLGNLDAFGMGLTLGTDLKMGIEFRSFTDTDSLALHQSLQGLLMMFSASAQSDPDTAQLLQGLSIRQSAQTVTAALHVPGALLERMAAKQAQAVGMTAESGFDVTAIEPAPQPRRQRQGVIRIDGLDGGPVEVQSGQ